MTTPTTRLAEIAERHEPLAKLLFATDWPPTKKQTTDEMWANHNRRGPDDAARRYLKLAAVAQDFILTAAQERERMDAEIMRDAAEGLHYLSQEGVSHGWAGMKYRCRSCDAEGPVHNILDKAREIHHTPDCLVTKLRTRADQLGGRADG